MSHIEEIPLQRIDGAQSSLAEFHGKVRLVVNVASKCGLTPQYTALEKLHESLSGQGFTVLGFPANDFGAQEPGTNEQIAEFCQLNFGVTFPMFQKIAVTGPEQHPLYRELTSEQPQAITTDGGAFKRDLEKYGVVPKQAQDVSWNFEKFLLDRSGQVVARFAPSVPPESPELLAAITRELGKPAG